MTPVEAICNTVSIASGAGPTMPPVLGDLINAMIGAGANGHEIAATLTALEDTFVWLPQRTMRKVN